MLKRGQVTIFIIAGLLVLFLLGFLLVYTNKPLPDGLQPVDRTSEAAVKSYVSSCIDHKVKEGINYFGLSGVAASQIAEYVDRNLADCADFSIFTEQGIAVRKGIVKSKVTISERAVDVTVKFPVNLESAGQKHSFESFDYSLSRVQPISEASLSPTGAVVRVNEEKKISKLKAELTIPRGTDVTGINSDSELAIEDRHFDGNSNDIVVGNTAYSLRNMAFSQPADLAIAYSDDDVPKNYDPALLSIARFDSEKDIWVSMESTVDKQAKKVTGKVTGAGTFAIVVNCKPTNSVMQINYTNWLFREQVYSTDRTLMNPNWDESSRSVIFALKEHKALKLSGGTGWNDANARTQIGTKKGAAAIRDWDMDDQNENDARCNGCTKNADQCKPKCQQKAKDKHKSIYNKDQPAADYLSYNKDAIKDGVTVECDSEGCDCTTATGQTTCQSQCPKSCTTAFEPGGNLATPNNYGYASIDQVGGTANFNYIMRASGNSCIAASNALKVDLRANDRVTTDGSGFCNDECRAKLNGEAINNDDRPIPNAKLKGGANTLEVEIINRKDAASYARGHIDLITGTGAYKRCELGKELKENCLCGTTNANVLEDKKKEDSDYGEFDVSVKDKKFCCADGSVADDASRCTGSGPSPPCQTYKQKILEEKDTGCTCGTQQYVYRTDGPGYCCPEQTCEGMKCAAGAGLVSGKTGTQDTSEHEYKLELKSGKYTVFMDGKQLKQADSQGKRPTGVDFGNNLRPTANIGSWTFMKIDYIKVLDSQGKEFFAEEFNSLDAGKWAVDKGDGVAEVKAGWIELRMNNPNDFTNKFPWVKSSPSAKIFPDSGDFTLTIKMQYPQVTGHGTYFWTSPNVFGVGQDNSAPSEASPVKYMLRVYLFGDMIYSCGGVGGCSAKSCEPREVAVSGVPATAKPASCSKPNKFGVHLMPEYSKEELDSQLTKAAELVGECGFVKNLAADIGSSPNVDKWAGFVKTSNEKKLVPMLRLQGTNSGNWQKPDPASYPATAAAYAKFIADVESKSGVKINYVEIWNEPNLAEEWSGQSDPKEYGKFLLAVAKAIREQDMKDGSKDTSIMNGGLAPTGSTSNGNYQTEAFIDAMFSEAPELKDYIDIWASHPYPPEETRYNVEKTKISEKGLRPKIMITEVSWKRVDGAVKTPQQFVDIHKAWVADSDVEGVVVWLLASKDPRWQQFALIDSNSNENEYYKQLKAYRISTQS